MAPRIVPPSANAEDLRLIVESVRASVARRAAECNALWSELIQLQVAFAFKDFGRHADAERLEVELMRLHNLVLGEMQRYVNAEQETTREMHRLASASAQADQELAGRPPEPPPGLVVKTVLQFDMAGYSTAADRLEKNFGPGSVAALNREIAACRDDALAALRIPRRQVLFSEGGDGALLAFDLADRAFDFAREFFARVRARNAQIEDASLHALHRRYFRVGAATGAIVFRPGAAGQVEAGGMTISNAVRIESGGRPGELTVHEETFQTLSDDRKAPFEADPVEVKGKRNEKFRVRRCIFDPDAAREAEGHGLWRPKT